MASSVPGPRQLPESAFNLSTYWGRVKHFAGVSDPRMLFNTHKDIEKSRELIWKYKNNEIKGMNSELWHAKRILDSTIHPDTGKVVMLPFRMSSYVLSNLIVTVGMLTPNLKTPGTIFWHVANQSLNVAINTANANKSHPLTIQQMVISYFAAVGASCGVAVGLKAYVPKIKGFSPGTRQIMLSLVPFLAVVSASMLNICLMRSEEVIRGISVYNERDPTEKLGTSRVAAAYAVGETGISRVINAAPVMAIPPLILMRLRKNMLKTSGNFTILMANLGLITATSFIALPFALGLFPQRLTMDVSHLESRFHNIHDKENRPVREVVFNRGI